MVTTWPSPTLGEALTSMTVDALKPLAGLCTSRLPTRKDELIKVIAEALRDRAFLTGQLEQLDRATRLALAEAAYGDGTVDPAWFTAKYALSFALPGSSWGYYGYGGYSTFGYGHKRDAA